MHLRILITFAAVTVCAIWPQGIILCAGDDGHSEFEIDGAPCCPDESGDCSDCVDTVSPELRGSPATVVLVAPATASLGAPDLPEPGPLAKRTEESAPPQLSPDDLRSVVLQV